MEIRKLERDDFYGTDLAAISEGVAFACMCNLRMDRGSPIKICRGRFGSESGRG